MTMKPDANPSKPHAKPRSVRNYATKVAKGTLIAAALAATRFARGEVEPDIRVFNAAIVDRLNEPLSRFHE